MRITSFSKNLWALALCLCLMGTGYAANEVGAYSPVSNKGINNFACYQAETSASPQTFAQDAMHDIQLIGQNKTIAFGFNSSLEPNDNPGLDGFDLDVATANNINMGDQDQATNQDQTLVAFVDFAGGNQAKPKPSPHHNASPNNKGDPWTEVSNWFKQYQRS